VEPVGIEPTWS